MALLTETGLMELHIFDDPVLMRLGPVPITETMVTSAIVTVVLIGLGAVMGSRVRSGRSDLLSTLALMTVESFDRLVEDIVGRRQTVVATIAATFFLFIAGCNLAGQLPGVHPATGSLATTSALAVLVFFSVPIAGIWSNGLWGYLKHYFRPNPLLMPLHVISELSRTLAMSVRLFGNIMSGHLVVGLLVALAGFLVPTPMMALDLLIGLLQAYIFAILSTVYIGAAMSVGEE
ncbi:F0F1 ATP synthase subunit A [Roseiconus nitratireducens]|uniref:ATP synthase subunit a n=1 Tax=Roseiconus nitratireducens TaxID=2605748 RepID=A0A5M6DF98_9BACT|nr:F0F1 ATP synthase subunit A [Roseiconus nitratireducens]KAA5546241.1 F0F1 ATP synthase subunit A [Roseiconus nitratireducens]